MNLLHLITFFFNLPVSARKGSCKTYVSLNNQLGVSLQNAFPCLTSTQLQDQLEISTTLPTADSVVTQVGGVQVYEQ